MSLQTCGNCRWFSEDQEPGGPSANTTRLGECRRHAPVIVAYTADGGYYESVVPRTRAAKFCGDWEDDGVAAQRKATDTRRTEDQRIEDRLRKRAAAHG